MNDKLGKDAEQKIREWLDKPEEGYSFDRIKDQMTGFLGSSNICDFTCFKSPYLFYIESKATWESRFEFSRLTDTQYKGLLKKSKIENVFGYVIILYATHKRAVIIDIRDIEYLRSQGKQSLNIDKISKWTIPYSEIQTIANSRKTLLDYTGELTDYIVQRAE